jgi:hypothetical protein
MRVFRGGTPLLLALIALALVAAASFAEDPPLPELRVPKLAKPAPKIDGKLDEEAWKEAATAGDFRMNFGERPEGKAKLYVARDDTTLYIAVECFEDANALKQLKAAVHKHDGEGIWGDDEVELFIDPTGKRASYYQIIVNAKGVTWDAYHRAPQDYEREWEPKYEVKTAVGADRWTLEMAIPFAAFDRSEAAAAEWAFNAARMRAAAGEFIYWSSVFKDSAHTPEKFGRLTNMPPLPLKGAAKNK